MLNAESTDHQIAAIKSFEDMAKFIYSKGISKRIYNSWKLAFAYRRCVHCYKVLKDYPVYEVYLICNVFKRGKRGRLA